MVRLSDMAINHPEIMEMDINPLLVHSDGNGATVADVRMILKKPITFKRPARRFFIFKYVYDKIERIKKDGVFN